MSQVVPTRRSTSCEINKVKELVQQGMLDYNLNQQAAPQASYWLTETIPKKEMSPQKKIKVEQTEFESKLVSS